MDRTTSTIITIAILVLALLGMYLGWRARTRRQSSLPRPVAVPADTGAQILSVDAFYVATTVADRELERVAIAGLGFRSRATVIVTETGLILDLAGTPDVFIPAASLRGVDRATYAIDRVVEKGGLVRIAWTLGAGTDTPSPVDSYVRTTDPQQSETLIIAIESLIPLTTSTEDTK